MNIVHLSCSSCGAPISVTPESEQLRCPYCDTVLYVQRSEGQIAFKMGEQVSKSIERGTERTQTELKRLQLVQEVSILQMQLSTLQAEIRALERQSKTRQVKKQLRDLRTQEVSLIGQIKSIQASLTPLNDSSIRSTEQHTQYAQLQQSPVIVTPTNPKNWVVAYLLCMFLGIFGAHRFYTGHILLGVIQLLTFGGFFIWWFIDLFMIALGKFKDSKGSLLNGPGSRTSRYVAIGISIFWVLYFLVMLGSQ